MAISKDNDRLTIIINKDLKRDLELIARQDKRSTSNYVASLLEEHIKDNPPKEITVHVKRIKNNKKD